MSYGANEAVNNAETERREDCANLIAQQAAALVAAGDMGRQEAIRKVAEWLRNEDEAGSDVTGNLSINNDFPAPSKVMAPKQVAAIASELLAAARDAADTL